MDVEMRKKVKNINTIVPEGKYFHQPSNRIHRDKTKFNRNVKHKNKNYE